MTGEESDRGGDLFFFFVMTGLDPAIHVFGSAMKKDVDGRGKPGH
jgi:hypothetical protein